MENASHRITAHTRIHFRKAADESTSNHFGQPRTTQTLKNNFLSATKHNLNFVGSLRSSFTLPSLGRGQEAELPELAMQMDLQIFNLRNEALKL